MGMKTTSGVDARPQGVDAKHDAAADLGAPLLDQRDLAVQRLNRLQTGAIVSDAKDAASDRASVAGSGESSKLKSKQTAKVVIEKGGKAKTKLKSEPEHGPSLPQAAPVRAHGAKPSETPMLSGDVSKPR